jgi:hypothetical protein
MHAPKWLIAALPLLIAANVWTILGTLAEMGQIQTLAVSYSVGVRLAMSCIWALVLLLLWTGLLGHQRLAFILVAPILTAYGLASLAWEMAFARSDYSRGHFSFQVVLTLVALLPVWWTALRRHWLQDRIVNQP